MKVFVGALFLLAVALCSVSGGKGLNNAELGDDWDDLYALMEKFLDTMVGIESQWSGLMDHTIDQIGVMSDRIVYTESLINDEGLQIGKMSDRIVETEALMKNLTEVCVHCGESNGAARTRTPEAMLDWIATDVPSKNAASGTATGREAARALPAQLRRAVRALVAVPVAHVGLGPIGPIIEFMEHTLDLFEEMSGNVTDEMQFMEEQIGSMADRIVVTECLIMNMSQQIGAMADRIVETEDMMANMTATCCHPSQQSSVRSGARHASAERYVAVAPAPHCNGTTGAAPLAREGVRAPASEEGAALAADLAAQRARAHALSTWVTSECAPWDVVCLAAEEMMKLAEKIEDTMFTMCTDMLNMTTEAALEVGKLSDDIVETEKLINEMGLKIGEMADLIVETEHMMLEFGKRFCGMEGMAAAQRRHAELSFSRRELMRLLALARARRAQLAAVLHRLSTLRARADALMEMFASFAPRARSAAAEALSFPNPAKWIDLMTKIMDTMLKMSETMMGNMNHILDGINQMAGRIVATEHDIESMADQIVTMAGRVVKTEQMMEELMEHCGM